MRKFDGDQPRMSVSKAEKVASKDKIQQRMMLTKESDHKSIKIQEP